MSKDKTASKQDKLKFKREKSYAFTIVDGLKKELGSVRVKPGAIGWKPAHETQWYELSLNDFQALIVDKGTKGGLL